ncbi:MAG: DNA gyrase subunit A [Candidatus Improbicoccus devescovinae]|nr:MAG: DNA gyrase subunit A [Candidatus Improbicoccus devescovinae]
MNNLLNINKKQGIIKNAGELLEQKIVSVIEKNYMPYAMSVIMSRAIPEIDGFKPSQRKVLYTMYKMGLLDSARTKSANIVGQTMKLNPHGDITIYETMARMSRGYEALSHPYVDSKGNFGKFYSRNMARAAARYTEAKLAKICYEIFGDIEKNTTQFVPNYDNTLQEPVLLPVKYPTILLNSSTGIAVGMASSICPFNLRELCQTTIRLIKNKYHNLISTLIAPDFHGGGEIVYDKDLMRNIYKTGRGNIPVRARYKYDAGSNCIDILNIPPTTTIEIIIEKIADLVKKNKITEISDIRDETGIEGLRITIDLKRGIDPDKFMSKLYKLTSLQDNFSCNFNVLISGTPRVFGVGELLTEWINFRINAVKRRLDFDLNKKNSKLHLLLGLEKVLLDIDKAISIIRNTDLDSQVVPNLMLAFNIDEIQADYIAEIRLRNINKEHILRKISEIESLKSDIANLHKILDDPAEIKLIIIKELTEISEKYGKDRICPIVNKTEILEFDLESEAKKPDYPVVYFFTREGYFKKIPSQNLKPKDEHKLKNGDEIIQKIEANNESDLLFFTNKFHAYKSKGINFPDMKVGSMGEFISANFGADENEEFKYMVVTNNYRGFMVFFFSNGMVAKVDMCAYETKTNRKKLIRAYSQKNELISCFYIQKDENFIINSSGSRVIVFNTNLISSKVSKDSQGVIVMKLSKSQKITNIELYNNKTSKYMVKKIPSVGFKTDSEFSKSEQLKF